MPSSSPSATSAWQAGSGDTVSTRGTETALVPQFANFGSQALDIGANIGYYTAWLRLAVGPSGHVHAFEANPATASLLARSVELNGWRNVTLNECAVSDETGELNVSYEPDFGEEREASRTTSARGVFSAVPKGPYGFPR